MVANEVADVVVTADVDVDAIVDVDVDVNVDVNVNVDVDVDVDVNVDVNVNVDSTMPYRVRPRNSSPGHPPNAEDGPEAGGRRRRIA